MAKRNVQIDLSFTVKDSYGLIQDKFKRFTNSIESSRYFRDVKAGKYGQVIGKPVFVLR